MSTVPVRVANFVTAFSSAAFSGFSADHLIGTNFYFLSKLLGADSV